MGEVHIAMFVFILVRKSNMAGKSSIIRIIKAKMNISDFNLFLSTISPL